jgi:hypothetical protein
VSTKIPQIIILKLIFLDRNATMEKIWVAHWMWRGQERGCRSLLKGDTVFATLRLSEISAL